MPPEIVKTLSGLNVPTVIVSPTPKLFKAFLRFTASVDCDCPPIVRCRIHICVLLVVLVDAVLHCPCVIADEENIHRLYNSDMNG